MALRPGFAHGLRMGRGTKRRDAIGGEAGKSASGRRKRNTVIYVPTSGEAAAWREWPAVAWRSAATRPAAARREELSVGLPD